VNEVLLHDSAVYPLLQCSFKLLICDLSELNLACKNKTHFHQLNLHEVFVMGVGVILFF